MSSLSDWLTTVGLERHAELFASNEVDLETLELLTEQDLIELGLPFGPRKRLLGELARRGAQPGSARPESPASEPLAAEERRQLTVMFCDLVNFTELASRLDPENLQSVMRAYEDRCAASITRYEGYVFQRLGDGVVAFFGFPLAHEGEAERAIRAGLSIIENLAGREFPHAGEMQVRIGIATGVVIVSPDGKSGAGQTMNLAARLQTLATPGSVVVSENVRRLAGRGFEYSDLGLTSLKGIERPVHVYRVLGLSKAASRFDAAAQVGLTRLVGRSEELQLLSERWDSARSGAGQVVLVTGEAGIGKSRVVSEFRQRISPRTAGLLHFQCSPYNVNSVLHPIAATLEREVGLVAGEGTSEQLDKLENFAVERFERPLEDVRFLAAILSIPTAERYGPLSLPPQLHRRRTVEALVDLIEAIARSAPTGMLFEDLHWVDATSLEVLDALVERVREVPLLVLLTARPAFGVRWSAEHFAELPVTKLSPEQSLALVEHAARGKQLPEGLAERIVAKTDGVPLFVEELTTTIIESGALREEGPRYVFVGRPADLVIPESLRDSLMARLDQVDSVKEVAQIGAAIGREFSRELISAVAGLEGPELEEALTRLTESGLAFRRGTLPTEVYTFKHALVQDVAYESLLKSRRRQLHGSIAQALEQHFPSVCAGEPELLAQHYSAADRPETAIPLWRRAGERALAHFAAAEASAHLQRGLESVAQLPRDAERDRLELALRTLAAPAVVAVHAWASPEVTALLEPALAVAQALDHEPSYIPILHGLWVHFMSAGMHAEALGRARTLLEVGARTGNGDITICGNRSAMTSHFWMGDFEQAREHGDRIRADYDLSRHKHIANLTNNDPLTADGSYRAQYLWMHGYPDQARALSDEKDEHARQRGHPFDLCFALTVGAQTYDYCRDPASLLARVEEAERVGRENHLPLMSEIMAQLVKGAAWLRAGHAGDAAELLATTLDRLESTGHRAWIPYVGANLAEALAHTGYVESGLARLEVSLRQIEEQQEESHLAEVLRLKGWMLMLSGRPDEAEQVLRSARDCALQQGARSWELRIAVTCARLLVEQGRKEAARAQLAEVYDSFSEGFDTPDLQDAKLLLDTLQTPPTHTPQDNRR